MIAIRQLVKPVPAFVNLAERSLDYEEMADACGSYVVDKQYPISGHE
ncbi:hypothetical protein ABXS71_20925 [Bacillus infantis]